MPTSRVKRLAFLFSRQLFSLSLLFFAAAPLFAETARDVSLTGGVTHSERLEPIDSIDRTALPTGNATAPPLFAVPSISEPSSLPQASVQYSTRAPHVDNAAAAYKDRLHAVMRQNALAQSRRGRTIQIKVPPWLAGHWQRTETNEVSRKELPSGKVLKAVGKQAAVVTDVFGMYKDRRGNVFMMVPLGNVGAIDRGFAIDYHQVKKYEMVMQGANSAVIKVQAVHHVVSKKDKQVIAAYQDEELNRYTLVKDGFVKNDSSVKVFDEKGLPKLITRAVSTERRVKRI